jgi:hypothetical protein
VTVTGVTKEKKNGQHEGAKETKKISYEKILTHKP